MAAGSSGRAAGKVVVVTGAAQGQGAAEAGALLREGATVVGVDVREPADPLDGVLYDTLDVSSTEGWAALAGRLRDTHGRVHGLVNNAAITDRTRLGEIAADALERVLAV